MPNTLTKQGLWLLAGETATWHPGTSGSPAYCVTTTVSAPGGHYMYDPGNPSTGRPAGVYWVNTGTVYSTVQQCYPETTGTQGYYTYTQNYTLSYSLGWTGGAYSIGSLAANGMFQFSVRTDTIGAVAGFNNENVGSAYAEIEHGIYFNNGLFMVVENGAFKTNARAYVTADVFTIVRLGTQVAYYQGTTLRYISTLRSSGTIIADASLYSAGDQIVNASLTATVTADYAKTNSTQPSDGPAVSQGITGVLRGLSGFSSDEAVEIGYVWAGDLTELTGNIQANHGGDYNTGSVTGVLAGLTPQIYGGSGAGANYSICAGRLTGLTSPGSEAGMFVPNYCIVSGALQGLTGFATALAGTSGQITAGNLTELTGFASNVEGGYVNPGLPPGGPGGVVDPATGDWPGRMGGYLRGLVGLAYSADAADGNFLVVDLPMLEFFGLGSTPSISGPDGRPAPGWGLFATLPVPEFVGLGGDTLNAVLPMLTFEATAVVTELGTLDKKLPPLRFSGAGVVTQLGGMFGTIPALEFMGNGGNHLDAALPALTFSGEGQVGRVGSAGITLPMLEFYGRGATQGYGGVTGVLTGVAMSGNGVAIMTLPPLWIDLGTGDTPQHTITGGVPTIAVEYEAYSITIIPSDKGVPKTATTHYTTFPFDRIVRFNSDYYGVAVDGLYRLGGDQFDGAPIVSVIETADEDFGSNQLKRGVGLYLAGRVGADFRVTMKSNELNDDLYWYRPVQKAGSASHRAVFGKGRRARYWSYVLTNTAGEDFDIDDLTPEVMDLRRTI